jgi:hypothetical protein
VSLSETRNPDYRDSHGRPPYGTTGSIPAAHAPDIPDEAFILVQQHNGNAATKLFPEFPKRVFEQEQLRSSYVC